MNIMNYGRKITGGRYHKQKKKKLYERKSQEKLTLLGETKRKILRILGGNTKIGLLTEKFVNLKIKNKMKKVEIKNVVETPQNRFLARKNILAKGAIIDTTEGKAVITNRPSREGCINARLLEKEK
jgi:small subunit ribosomal protein S8e